jgi:hypothetical protein
VGNNILYTKIGRITSVIIGKEDSSSLHFIYARIRAEREDESEINLELADRRKMVYNGLMAGKRGWKCFAMI